MVLHLRRDVHLETINPGNAELMYQWMLDPDISQNLGLRNQPSLERTRQWITRALDDPAVHPYAVLLNEQHVGNVILDRLDDYLQSARLSVYIGETQARGCGVGTTGIYLVMHEGFHQFGLNKIWLTVHSQNIAAINAYLRLGFQLEGILRDEFLMKSERISAFYMGILLEDFSRLAINWDI